LTSPSVGLRRVVIGDILLCEGTRDGIDLFAGKVALVVGANQGQGQDEERVMIRRNLGVVLTAAAVIGLLLVAFILALAQDKLPELALELIVYLFAITLGVFVIERMLAWREERRWLAAKNWLYMILLETIDDLLKELLPATVPDEGSSAQTNDEGEIAVYEVSGERVHFGEVVAYSPLRLLVGPEQRELQSHIRSYVERVGPPRYAEMARAALSDAREQIRDMLASSGQLLEADITAMVMSSDQAIAAAIRHLDSAASMREEKLEGARHLDEGGSSKHGGTEEADDQLAFVTSIIVESVVDSAIKPKAWLEEEIRNQEGRSAMRGLRGGARFGMGSTKQRP
jgi:hypothetical protein